MDFEQAAKDREQVQHLTRMLRWSQQNNRNFIEIHRHLNEVYFQLAALSTLSSDAENDKEITNKIMIRLVAIEKAKQELRKRKIPN